MNPADLPSFDPSPAKRGALHEFGRVLSRIAPPLQNAPFLREELLSHIASIENSALAILDARLSLPSGKVIQSSDSGSVVSVSSKSWAWEEDPILTRGALDVDPEYLFKERVNYSFPEWELCWDRDDNTCTIRCDEKRKDQDLFIRETYTVDLSKGFILFGSRQVLEIVGFERKPEGGSVPLLNPLSEERIDVSSVTRPLDRLREISRDIEGSARCITSDFRSYRLFIHFVRELSGEVSRFDRPDLSLEMIETAARRVLERSPLLGESGEVNFFFSHSLPQRDRYRDTGEFIRECLFSNFLTAASNSSLVPGNSYRYLNGSAVEICDIDLRLSLESIFGTLVDHFELPRMAGEAHEKLSPRETWKFLESLSIEELLQFPPKKYECDRAIFVPDDGITPRLDLTFSLLSRSDADDFSAALLNLCKKLRDTLAEYGLDAGKILSIGGHSLEAVERSLRGPLALSSRDFSLVAHDITFKRLSLTLAEYVAKSPEDPKLVAQSLLSESLNGRLDAESMRISKLRESRICVELLKRGYEVIFFTGMDDSGEHVLVRRNGDTLAIVSGSYPSGSSAAIAREIVSYARELGEITHLELPTCRSSSQWETHKALFEHRGELGVSFEYAGRCTVLTDSGTCYSGEGGSSKNPDTPPR